MPSSIPVQTQRTVDCFQQADLNRLRASLRKRLTQLTDSSQASDQPTPAASIPSPDGRWLAWPIIDSATDLQTWQVRRNGDTGEFPEQIEGVYPTGIAWLPDSSGFYYDRFLAYPGGHGLYFHKIGTPQRQDVCHLYQPAHPEWYYQPTVSPDGRWLVVSTLNGSAANLLTVGRTASPTYKQLISRFVGRYDILHWRDEELFCRCVEPDALNGQLIAFDLSSLPAEPPTRRVLLPAGDLPLLDVAPLGKGWVASYLNGGRSELRLLNANGEWRETIPLPGLGTVEWLEVEPADNCLRFAYTDYARPAQIYTWQPGEAVCQPEGDPPPLTFDPADFVTCACTVTSADGTHVPLFLAHRRDAPPALCPTLLTAYGGLGHSLTPRFCADALAWMEMGGLYVSVCARGGGELGESWHQAGVGAHKQNTFDDVLAVVRWLLTAKMTTPQQLGLWGTSNGGLTAGACLTQQPELFGAVVIESGLLDMLDYHRLGRGQDWLAEYGDPDDPAQREVLAAYSPLHNIQAGIDYPATLITTSDDDPRVGEVHSLRFAESLQAAQAGTAPVLLRVDPGGGHGDQPTRAQWLERTAHRLAFFAVHLGLADG